MSASRRRRASGCAFALLAALGAPAALARKPAPELPQEHRHEAGGFTFHTPEGWTVAAPAGRPDVLEASSESLRLRLVWRKGGQGFDAAHVVCMLERLAPAMEAAPEIRYEYDFVSGEAGGRRFLDSAFEIRYDQPVLGAKNWRQRALTVVGDSGALCIVSATPAAAWRKSATRALMDAIVGSINFDN